MSCTKWQTYMWANLQFGFPGFLPLEKAVILLLSLKSKVPVPNRSQEIAACWLSQFGRGGGGWRSKSPTTVLNLTLLEGKSCAGDDGTAIVCGGGGRGRAEDGSWMDSSRGLEVSWELQAGSGKTAQWEKPSCWVGNRAVERHISLHCRNIFRVDLQV